MTSRNLHKVWRFHILLRLKGSILPQLIPRALIAAAMVLLLRYLLPNQFSTSGSYLMWHPTPFSYFLQLAIFSVAFHTNQAYNRYWEARTHVQTMASYWGDLISQLIIFDEQNVKPEMIADGSAWRAKIAHLVSLLHAVSIQYLLNRYSNCVELEVLGGVSEVELQRLSVTNDQSFLVSHWILQACASRQNNGGLNVPGPIVSRSWQVISLGMLSFNQACKIEDTPFPFPYVQLLYIMDWTMSFVVPLVVISWIKDTVFAVVLSILAICTFQAMFATACIMENPFGQSPNDLPLQQLHDDFVTRIKSLLDYPVAVELHNMILRHSPVYKQPDSMPVHLGQVIPDEKMSYNTFFTKHPHLSTGTNLPNSNETESSKSGFSQILRTFFMKYVLRFYFKGSKNKKNGQTAKFAAHTGEDTRLGGVCVDPEGGRGKETHGLHSFNGTSRRNSRVLGIIIFVMMEYVIQRIKSHSGVDLSVSDEGQGVKMHLGTLQKYKMGPQIVQGIFVPDDAHSLSSAGFYNSGEIEREKSSISPSRLNSLPYKTRDRHLFPRDMSYRTDISVVDELDVSGKATGILPPDRVNPIRMSKPRDLSTLKFDRSLPFFLTGRSVGEAERLSVNSDPFPEGNTNQALDMSVRKGVDSYSETVAGVIPEESFTPAISPPLHNTPVGDEEEARSYAMDIIRDNSQMGTATLVSSQSTLPGSTIRRMGTLRIAQK
ncbi:hypothetical protein IE077_004031 [Cardiosporidium cionae]|uniref:Uncharacterized protein n=1 Tax=Cardiosporidium cionae TaxID=476202 RepID=A0ABQ7JE72_9APIC|nr:hypothetical protein IE077_004031 [Cardiosporidium cionae]|eukprot:KAF8822298.1 hypothetical protein IE077_004031 [Cardiosporidium cionae]